MILEQTNDCETCREHWSLEDFRNIDYQIDWRYLEDHNWTVDCCGNAVSGDYSVLNNGILIIDGQLEMTFTDWIDDPEFLNEHSQLHALLTKNLA